MAALRQAGLAVAALAALAAIIAGALNLHRPFSTLHETTAQVRASREAEPRAIAPRFAVPTEVGAARIGRGRYAADTNVDEGLTVLPEGLRAPGSVGSCMANFASSSAAGLGIHSCRKSKVRDASREASGPHPELLAEGQCFRKRRRCPASPARHRGSEGVGLERPPGRQGFEGAVAGGGFRRQGSPL
jgi:hypothetical protein